MKEIFITGVITPKEYDDDFKDTGLPSYSYNDLVRDLAGARQATVYIDSIGGMVEEGMLMYNLLKGLDITTVSINASSIASIVFLAGKERLVSPTAEMIIHNAWIKGKEIEDMTLNANTLTELKAEFEEMDGQLVNIYKEKTGLEETKLLALMSQETDIGSQAVELGFATGYYEEEIKPTKVGKNKLIMFNQKSINMATEAAEKRLTAIEVLMKGLTTLFKGNSKNMVVKLNDGTEVFVYSEDGEFEGKRAVIASEGMPTEENAPEGEHTISDGRVITVGADGIITSVSEAVDGEALASQIVALEEEKKAMEEEKEKMNVEIQALKAAAITKEKEFTSKFEEISKEMKALKSEVMGGGDPIKPIKAAVIDPDKPLSFSDRMALKAKAKIQESKR